MDLLAIGVCSCHDLHTGLLSLGAFTSLQARQVFYRAAALRVTLRHAASRTVRVNRSPCGAFVNGHACVCVCVCVCFFCVCVCVCVLCVCCLFLLTHLFDYGLMLGDIFCLVLGFRAPSHTMQLS